MFLKSKCIIVTLLRLVVLSGCSSNGILKKENSKAELSPTFSIPVKFGKEGVFARHPELWGFEWVAGLSV